MYNIITKTKDGKKLTYRELEDAMDKDLREGRDCLMTDGKKTWTQRASEYKGREGEREEEEDRELERERERRGKEEREIAMLHEGQTMTTGRPTMSDGQVTTSGQTTAAGPMTLTDERTRVKEQAATVGQTMTTGQATIGQLMTTDERMTETPDEQTLTTEVLEGPGIIRDGDPEIMPTEGVADISGVLLTVDGQPMIPVATEEEAILVEVDPLAFESPGSGTPVRPVSCTSATPRSLFMTPEENTPSVSGRVHDGSVTPEVGVDKDKDEDIVARGPRVAGRKVAVVEDDVETLSSESSTSVGWDSSMASSSRAKGKGIKRGREVSKGKDCRKKEKIEGSSEESRKKRKGKGKVTGKKDTPEEEPSVGKCGEPKGIVQHALEDMSSSVLGGAMREWVHQIDGIRVKSKNLQGKLSGEIKSCLAKILDGSTLLVIRAEATGDPHFLRMRNSELASQLKEAQGEIARLEEQIKRTGSGSPSPLRKRIAAKAAAALDASRSIAVDPLRVTETEVLPSSMREEFPPLPQRLPRDGKVRKYDDRMVPMVRAPSPSAITGGSMVTETSIEACYSQQINALVAAREFEREKIRREHRRKDHVGFQDERKGAVTDKDKGRDKDGKRKDGDGRVGPRIISNVQLVPSFKERLKDEASTTTAKSTSETEWRVVDRRRKRDNYPVSDPGKNPRGVLCDVDVRATGNHAERRPPPPKQQPKVRMPKPPLSSAVAITGRAEGFSYAAAMKSARESINLESLGINATRIRKALNGGLLIEVSGEGSRAKAEELVTRLRDVLKDSAAVSCPTKKRELRVSGFDESVSAEEISEMLSKSGGCSTADVKIGPIRILNNGLGAVWVQLPVAAAAKVAELERIRLGWTVARVELLKARPLQCYRCWSYGHVQNTCRSTVDRSGACFKCGRQGHMASGCQNAVHCALCHDAGLEAVHRLGGPQCLAQVQRSTSGRPTTTTT